MNEVPLIVGESFLRSISSSLDPDAILVVQPLGPVLIQFGESSVPFSQFLLTVWKSLDSSIEMVEERDFSCIFFRIVSQLNLELCPKVELPDAR